MSTMQNAMFVYANLVNNDGKRQAKGAQVIHFYLSAFKMEEKYIFRSLAIDNEVSSSLMKSINELMNNSKT